MKVGTLVGGHARSLSGFDGNASFETPPLAAPQDEALHHGEEAEGCLEP